MNLVEVIACGALALMAMDILGLVQIERRGAMSEQLRNWNEDEPARLTVDSWWVGLDRAAFAQAVATRHFVELESDKPRRRAEAARAEQELTVA